MTPLTMVGRQTGRATVAGLVGVVEAVEHRTSQFSGVVEVARA